MDILEAIKSGNLEQAKLILAADSSVADATTGEGLSYVTLAMYHRQVEIAELLAAKKTSLALHEACALGHLQRVQELLLADAENAIRYSPDGFAPVALAAYFGHPELVRLLLGAGADVNAQARNPMKVAAIHAAVSTSDEECVKILLENGADPNLPQQDGITPLSVARANKNDAIVQMLIAAGGR